MAAITSTASFAIGQTGITARELGVTDNGDGRVRAPEGFTYNLDDPNVNMLLILGYMDALRTSGYTKPSLALIVAPQALIKLGDDGKTPDEVYFPEAANFVDLAEEDSYETLDLTYVRIR